MQAAVTPSRDALLAPPVPPGDPGSSTALAQQFLRLTIGCESYAVPIARVREILEISRLTPLPLAPDFVRGVMNLRGAVVPVIDMNARFGRAASQIGKRSCIVIVEGPSDAGSRGTLIGALVDGVSEVMDIPDVDIEPVPPLGTHIPPEFIHGMARARGQIYAVINLAHTLGEEQMASLVAASNVQ